jgi:hypothetical protein
MHILYRVRCLKKRRVESEYYIEEVSIQKDAPEYYKENFDVVVSPPEPQLIQIQPILTISEVISSIKQSLQDLADAVTPKRWSTAAPTITEEKSDLAI